MLVGGLGLLVHGFGMLIHGLRVFVGRLWLLVHGFRLVISWGGMGHGLFVGGFGLLVSGLGSVVGGLRMAVAVRLVPVGPLWLVVRGDVVHGPVVLHVVDVSAGDDVGLPVEPGHVLVGLVHVHRGLRHLTVGMAMADMVGLCRCRHGQGHKERRGGEEASLQFIGNFKNP